MKKFYFSLVAMLLTSFAAFATEYKVDASSKAITADATGVIPKNTIEAGKYIVEADVALATGIAEAMVPETFKKYIGAYKTNAWIEGDEKSLVINENAEEGFFSGFEVVGDAVAFNADKKIVLGGKEFTVRAAGNEAEAGSLAITPANEEGEYKMDAADIYYNGMKIATVSDIKITVAPEEVVVDITYVDGDQPTTALYDANATQWKAGYNGISNGAVTYPRTDWNCNWITYVGVDARTMKGETVTNATLKMQVSGSTDNRRGTTWGVGYNTTPWSAGMTDETADKNITLLGGTQNAASGSSKFTDLTFDVTDAFKDSKMATLLIYETAAAGGYIKNITVEVKVGSVLEGAKNKALEAVNAIPAGEGLFLCPQADIDAYKAAVEAATSVEEIEALQLPETQKPEADKSYQFANVSAEGTYLGQAVLSADPVPVKFEETTGGYYLNVDGKYLNMAGGDTWSMNATETASTVWKINVANGAYTIQGPNGLVGTDNKDAGSATYGNKTAANNGTWNITVMKNDDDEPTDIDALDNCIYVEPADIMNGCTKELEINMKNAQDVKSLSFSIELPEGIDIALDEDDEYDIYLDFSRIFVRKGVPQHTMAINKVDNEYRIAVTPTSTDNIKDNEGSLIIMNLRASEDAKAGDYLIKFKNIDLKDADGNSIPGTEGTLTVKSQITITSGTNTDTVTEVSEAPAKNIKVAANGQLLIGKYNVAGQQVK